MTYRISYIDTSPTLPKEEWPEGMARSEDYPTEPVALARARELLDNIHCHRILMSDGTGEPVGGVCLQVKLGLTGE
jgi:hypothetical protein